MLKRSKWMVLGIAALAALGFAPSRTIRWTVASPEDYDKGTLENVIVSATGELSLGAPRVRIESDAVTVWSSATDKSGAVYFGTGNEGKLYQLTADRKLKELGKTGELVISALAIARDGKLYAATIPAGKIFVFDAGQFTHLATLPDPYVWSLAAVDHGLVAGTGPNGKVYKIDPAGKVETWFETKQSHVLSLARDGQGHVFAGTSPSGVLFRIAPAGQGEVVFNTEEQEIRALAWVKGTLWMGANKSKKFDPKKFVKRLQAAAAQAQEGEEKESPFQELFDGSVYRYENNGPARLVQSFPKSYITSVAVEMDETVWVATGDEGRVWRLSSDGSASLVAKLKESQAMTLAVHDANVVAIGTGNAAAVYAFTSSEQTGSFTSEIKDAGFPATWGTIAWDATGPLTIQTRSGNTAKPESGMWSEWSAPLAGSPAKSASPVGRYFQFRVTWPSGSKAALKWVNVFYRTQNQKPQIKDVEVDGFDEKNAFAGKGRDSNEINIRWKPSDPDGDDLVFRLYAQREGREEWIPLTPTPVAKKDFKWDTAQMAEGWYRVKIVASDEGANPADAALNAAAVTRPILIDLRKPQFENVTLRAGAISGTVTDASSVIARLEYSVNGGPWQYVLPADGMYDEGSEKFTITMPRDAGAGEQHVTLRAFDAGGNAAVYQDALRP